MLKTTTLLCSLLKNLAIILFYAFLGTMLYSHNMYAWGPERDTYTNENPASYAVFNSITDNVAVGDERNFVRIRDIESDEPFSDEVEISPGREYEVYIYYHNNAASDTNASGFGIASNVRVSSTYPAEVSADENGIITGELSWSYVTSEDPENAKTGKVWDEAYVTTKTDGIVLRYKEGTAIIHNSGEADGSILPTDFFAEQGTPIGFNKLEGVIPGCAEYSGHITYTLVAEKQEEPDNNILSFIFNLFKGRDSIDHIVQPKIR